MMRRCTAICLSAGLFTALALAENRDESVAYVYVSNNPANSTDNQIQAFAARADGHLFPVSGSPFRFDATALLASGNHLFTVNRTAPLINTYVIQPNGTLELQRSIDYARFSPGDCGTATSLFSDRTGTDLYTMDIRGDCANNMYQSFAVHGPTGRLKFLGTVNGGAGSFSGAHFPATFLGNDLYAYEANNNGCLYYAVHAFRRRPNGLLADSNITVGRPAPPPGRSIYIPTFAAADPANHVAITLIPANPPGCDDDENVQIASFTAAANGNLTTTNTFATMPATSIRTVTDLKISPAGNLLAIGGAEGMQLFHFNGANPVTPYTGILTVDPITQIFWDRRNHLYAISQRAGRLHVFTITATTWHEAPGSPYPIPQPEFLAVLPLQ